MIVSVGLRTRAHPDETPSQVSPVARCLAGPSHRCASVPDSHRVPMADIGTLTVLARRDHTAPCSWLARGSTAPTRGYGCSHERRPPRLRDSAPSLSRLYLRFHILQRPHRSALDQPRPHHHQWLPPPRAHRPPLPGDSTGWAGGGTVRDLQGARPRVHHPAHDRPPGRLSRFITAAPPMAHVAEYLALGHRSVSLHRKNHHLNLSSG